MHRTSVNYKLRDDSSKAGFNRAYHLRGIPRLLLLCSIFGHQPLVDGHGTADDLRASRWVTCNRCGIRPEPQGSLSPQVWDLGVRYTGTWGPAEYEPQLAKRLHIGQALRPGPWPRPAPTGGMGAQVIIWDDTYPQWGFTLKVGKTWSENTLAFSIHFGRFLRIYGDTDKLGMWLVRRLNRADKTSKVIEFRSGARRINWKVWTDRDGTSRNTWRAGSVQFSLTDKILGPAQFTYDVVLADVTATVRLPHGDDHEVLLRLERETYGRRRGSKKLAWNVDWDCSPGIPTKNGGRGRINGSSVKVSDEAVRDGTWPAEAAAAIAVRICRDRTSEGMGVRRDLAVAAW